MGYSTSEERLLDAINKVGKTSLGQCGSIIIDDTDEHEGPYVAVTALAEAVIDTSECDLGPLADQPDTITIPQGVTIYGQFNSIELDSGTVIAYKKC